MERAGRGVAGSRWIVGVVVLAGVLTGCQVTDGSDSGPDAAPTPAPTPAPAAEPAPRPSGESPGATASGSPPTPTAPTETTSGSPGSPGSAESPEPAEAPSEPAAPVRFRAAEAQATVRWLAGRIGPREATTRAYRRAAEGVQQRLSDLGYTVERQRLRVPAGVSWGVPVPAGRTWNVVATPEGFRPGRSHLLIGAHLDTVPQAPGAEDNASGVAVLLELARMVARDGARLPVVFVAFGAEEPRGEGDDMHHFGSQAYVARMSERARSGLRAMVSLDRVGVGSVVPVCTGGLSPPRVRNALARAARRIDVPVQRCDDNTSSDHWSFEKAGEAAARVGSTPYAAYHSAQDRPHVVEPAQLGRAGRMVWRWLTR